jgi:hypothetical protein
MRNLHRYLTSALAGLMISGLVTAGEVPMNPGHPDRYTVVKGDTLWDISSMFLRDPWRWSDIWYVNPQIENPHLIYPGDVLELTYVNGQPRLQLHRGPMKLSPRIKSSPIDEAIPLIPVSDIQPFLKKALVIDANALDDKPYVVAMADDHIMAGAGQRIYVMNIPEGAQSTYQVVRKGDVYHDADTQEVIGYEALDIGSAVIQKLGQPATALLTDTQQEVLTGDFLVKVEEDLPLTAFQPKAPDTDIHGSIIDLFDAITQVGQYDVVAIDRGANDGLKVGNVLDIMHKGATVKNTVTPDPNDMVKLPDEKAGLLMVFRTFDRVSFGIILNSTRAVHLLDRVKSVE